MSTPQYVPSSPNQSVRSYVSPDAIPGSWSVSRRAEVGADQPRGGSMGHQGPDQGYALRLSRRFDDRVRLSGGEDRHDVHRGVVQIALKRASLFGRAPTIHDLEIGYRVWGFLDDSVAEELVSIRRALFEGVAERHHYAATRRLVAAVPDATLRLDPAEVAARHQADWADLLSVDS